MRRYRTDLVFLTVMVVVTGTLSGRLRAQEARPVPVFVLAGQSNMQGQAVVDLDHPEAYNGGRGTLKALLANPHNQSRMGHLRAADGNWAVREDVWIRYQTPEALKRGGLGLDAQASLATADQIQIDQRQGNPLASLLAAPKCAIGSHLRPMQRALIVGHALQASPVGLDLFESPTVLGHTVDAPLDLESREGGDHHHHRPHPSIYLVVKKRLTVPQKKKDFIRQQKTNELLGRV